MSKYTLTAEQQQELQTFVDHQLADVVDEFIHGEFLITDELLERDDVDGMEARKAAAVEYLKTLF